VTTHVNFPLLSHHFQLSSYEPSNPPSTYIKTVKPHSDSDNEVINALAEHGINDQADPPVVSASVASSACGLLWTLTAGLEDLDDPNAADTQIDKLAGDAFAR
jgi:hypothetical protein